MIKDEVSMSAYRGILKDPDLGYIEPPKENDRGFRIMSSILQAGLNTCMTHAGGFVCGHRRPCRFAGYRTKA